MLARAGTHFGLAVVDSRARFDPAFAGMTTSGKVSVSQCGALRTLKKQ